MLRRDRKRMRTAANPARWTPAEAREFLREHQDSGLSLAAFARKRRIRAQRLAWWGKRLAVRARVAPASPQRFVAVTLRPPTGEIAPAPAACIEIALRGGRQVRFSGGFDPVMLARLIETLEAIPC